MQLSLFGGTSVKLDKDGAQRTDAENDERLRPRAKSPWSSPSAARNRATLFGFVTMAMVTEPRSLVRFLSALGEPTDVPGCSPNRGPPYWKSTLLRRKALGDVA